MTTARQQASGLPISTDSRRAFDRRYLDRPARTSRPHYFPFVVDHAEPWLRTLPAPRVCELGCANGAFATYLLDRVPEARFTGVDVEPHLVEAAREEIPCAQFIQGDILTPTTLPRGPFHAVFALTVHSLFDDLATWVDAIARLIGAGGRAFVFGLFNPEPVDVLVRVRDVRSNTGWLPGWNQPSEATVRNLLEARGLDSRFTRYAPQTSRSPDPGDPLRSHTVAVQDQGTVYVNGAQVLHQFALLEVAAL